MKKSPGPPQKQPVLRPLSTDALGNVIGGGDKTKQYLEVKLENPIITDYGG